MAPLDAFFWGAGGSLAVEIINLHRYYESRGDRLPQRYRNPIFWLVRILLAGVAGGLAVAYRIDNPILAANIGASAPLILQALAQGVVPDPMQIRAERPRELGKKQPKEAPALGTNQGE